MTRERRSIRFRLALRTCAPWGARVVGLTKSRKIPTRKTLPLFFQITHTVPAAVEVEGRRQQDHGAVV